MNHGKYAAPSSRITKDWHDRIHLAQVVALLASAQLGHELVNFIQDLCKRFHQPLNCQIETVANTPNRPDARFLGN